MVILYAYDELKLRIAVGMVGALFRFPICLQAVVHAPQQLRHRLMTDRMAGGGQRPRQRARALERPPQGRWRIAARERLHQRLQLFR